MTSITETAFFGAAGILELDDARVRALAPAAFKLTRLAREFDGVAVERIKCRSLEFRGLDEFDHRESVDCVFVESGQALLKSIGSSQPLTSSQVGFFPSWEGCQATCAEEAVFLIIRVDTASLSGMVPRLPVQHEVVPFREGLMSATHRFAESTLATTEELTAVESYAMAQLLSEMVGSMMLDLFGLGSTTNTASARLRDQAIAVITQRRADPSLGIDDVAASVLVSPRRLQAAFAEASTTVSAEIRRLRASLAVHLLTTTRYNVLGIDEVARESGFGSTLSMRRALKELHGATPSEIRRERGETSVP